MKSRQARLLSTKDTDDLSSDSGYTWWNQRTDSCKLSYEQEHMVHTYMYTHAHMYTHIAIIFGVTRPMVNFKSPVKYMM